MYQMSEILREIYLYYKLNDREATKEKVLDEIYKEWKKLNEALAK